MYIVLLSVGAGVVFYALGALVAGWIAGFVPAILAMAVVAVMLFRKVSGEVRADFEKAAAAMQAGKIPEAKELLRAALRHERWWFAVPEQVHGQLGQIAYSEAVGFKMQAKHGMASKIHDYKEKLAEAKTELVQAWERDFQSHMVLGLVYHRESQVDPAVEAFKKAAPHAANQPLFWGIYAWVLNEAHKREEALLALGEGLKGSPKHAGLTAMQEALSNKRRPDMKVWGETWWAMFPEEIPQDVLREMAIKAGHLPPQPQQARAPIPQKGPPPMRGGGRPR